MERKKDGRSTKERSGKETRGRYTEREVMDALDRVRRGESCAAVARTSVVPLRTLFKRMEQQETSGAIENQRRGPKPVLRPPLESDMAESIAAMQRASLPPSRREILQKANQVYERMLPPSTRSAPFKPLSSGWYRRFRERHPDLSDRRAQLIARVRNSANKESVHALFNTLLKITVENKLDAARMFNMDETAFVPDSKSRSVVAVKGSKCVWTKESKVSFHMTIVAAVSAAGVAVPPLIILPGVRLHKANLRAITVRSTSISGAPKGFSNTALFELWLRFFADHHKETNAVFPVVLVLDNTSTHLDIGSVNMAVELDIMLVLLPPSATHLFQPLDVAMFKPFKAVIRSELQALLATSSDSTVSKSTAIKLACKAYAETVIERPENAVSGFSCTGIFSLNLVQLMSRLQLHSSGGVKGDLGTASWLKRTQQQVRDDVLPLPPELQSTKKQIVTVDIAGRFVGAEEADV